MLIIKIQNDGTGDFEQANYYYSVAVNDEIIARGYIEQHNRSEGWKKLVKLLLEDNAIQNNIIRLA